MCYICGCQKNICQRNETKYVNVNIVNNISTVLLHGDQISNQLILLIINYGDWTEFL
jgi:hypothetical protein